MLVQLEFDKDITPMLTSDTVKNCLTDPTVQKLLKRVELRSVADTAALSVVICEHLRMKYGLFNDQAPSGSKARDTLKSGKDTDEDGNSKPTSRYGSMKKPDKTRRISSRPHVGPLTQRKQGRKSG